MTPVAGPVCFAAVADPVHSFPAEQKTAAGDHRSDLLDGHSDLTTLELQVGTVAVGTLVAGTDYVSDLADGRYLHRLPWSPQSPAAADIGTGFRYS